MRGIALNYIGLHFHLVSHITPFYGRKITNTIQYNTFICPVLVITTNFILSFSQATTGGDGGCGIKGSSVDPGGAYAPPSTFLDVIGAQNGGAPLDGQTLTVALDVVQAWAVLVTVGFTLVLFLFLAFCVCAKKDDGYDEFDLDQGITTVKVCHDGGENGLSAFPPRINGSGVLKGSEDGVSEASSRCTLKRELPAIPQSAQPDPSVPMSGCGVERTQSQHSSDLYAAVGDVGDGGGNVGKVIGGVQVLPSGAIGPDGRAAIIRDPHHPSSTPTSPTEPPGQGSRPEGGVGPGGTGQGVSHPYAKVKKNHPYAHVKLPKKEHPYAKVVRDGSEDPETDTDNYDDPKAISKDSKSPGWESEGGYEPAPPVPEKRFDIEEETAHGSAPATQEPPSPRPTAAPEQPPEIQAALAISGRTPANEEMPYMTPPLHHARVEVGQQQQNFSGDSQDSRGYTSISVREPLAALKAQTQTSGPAAQPSAPHVLEGEGYYMTVSDDSADEMYACIYEGSGRGGTGSETYAQIEPRSSPPPPLPSMTSSPPPNAPSTPSPLSSRSGGGGGAGVTQQEPPPPAPPSVDSLKHVVHSRQASSGSAASTVMGSPGTEKRGTRSPLPPLPQGDPSLYNTAPPPAPQQPPPPPHSPPRPTPTPERPTQRALEEMYAKVMKKQRGGHSRGDSSGGGGGESDAASTASSSSRRGSVDAARWSAHASPPVTPRQSVDLGSMTRSLVETRPTPEAPVSMSRAKSYEKAGGVWSVAPPPAPHNPNYETIPQQYPGSDPGYETVKTSEPAYASVERPDDHYPGYETVKTTSDIDSEAGYETLKHRQDESGYETVTGQTGIHPPSEPGYETVAQEEPGYETVANSRPDPGYEELKFTSRHSSQGEAEPGYEVVKQTQSEGTYEFMRDYDTQGAPVFTSNQEVTAPLYATVNKSPITTTAPPTQTFSPTLTQQDSGKDMNLPLTKLVDMPAERTSPTSTQIPKAVSPTTKSPDKASPPSRKNSKASSSKKSPEQESPPMMKSPSPDIDSPPARKSPKSSPPALPSPGKESPPMMKSPSPDIESPKQRKSSQPGLPSPDRDSPPMMKSPSPDLEIPTARKSPIASPAAGPIPGKETPPLMKSPSLDVESPSAGRESPPMMKSPSPDLEVGSTKQEELDKAAGVTKTVGFDVATVSRKSSSSSGSTSPVQVGAPTTIPVSGDVGVESASPIQHDIPPPVSSQPLTQDLEMEATTSFSEEAGPESLPTGLNDNLEESSALTVSEEAETLPIGPPPPGMCGAERETSPLAFSSLGSEDLPPPLAVEDGHTQPQETVNPLYLLDDMNGGDQQMNSGTEESHEPPSMMLCGDLPPPPPSDVSQPESIIINDLPPPVLEASSMMPRTSTLCEDEAPPPLVPPGEVEGLEDLMGLGSGTGAGSSSSGSTAGQPGSLHANSDKDSDSPQEPTAPEGAADDLPPPPPLSEPTANRESDEEEDKSVSSGYEKGFVASGVTVTVNPGSDPEDSEGSPVSVLPPPPPPTSEASDLPSDIPSQSDPAPVADIPADIPVPSHSDDAVHTDIPDPLPPPLSDTPELPPPPPSDTQSISDSAQSPPPPPSSDTPQPPPPLVDTPEPPPPSDTPQPPPPPLIDAPPPPPPQVTTAQPLPPPSPGVAIGSQSSSNGSGSQDTGTGSIESVITTGTGQEPAPSDSSPSPPETQNVDQDEQITPV